MDEPYTKIDLISTAGYELGADAIMPVQFYSTGRASVSGEPVLGLMHAVLVDGLRCFQRNFETCHRQGQQEFREAQFWIFQDKGSGPFSFEDVCDVLGVDPGRLRDLIVRWENDRRSIKQQRTTRGMPINLAKRSQSRREMPSRWRGLSLSRR
jgi:hypothetical protein